jgi:leucyl-tRNA synthetase
MSMSTVPPYEFAAIERKWQKRWAERKTFAMGQRQKPKKYVLEMLPYPSGKMHVGHVRNYLLGDVYARYFRMRGYDVVHPMGWDAFGLPAENAAIKDGVHPATRTQENIAGFRLQLQQLGFSYDWALEINTSSPEYYRWNQWFFLKMRELDLVYRRFSKVNWCTGCLTVIANEQVKEGTCERCESAVEERQMPEWAFRITRYSHDLLESLDTLTEWPDRITAAQRHWIGKSEGVEVKFAVAEKDETVTIFTTRVDTIFGCTYLVLAPDSPVVQRIVSTAQRAEVEAFAAQMAKKSKVERAESSEKVGVFTGAFAINPFTLERIPVWCANFVLSDYGTGAVMAVPAHDARDFAFATKYHLPIRHVVSPASSTTVVQDQEAFTDDGVLHNSQVFDGLTSAEARRRIGDAVTTKGIGTKTTTWRQKDWGFSRQRYWGTPIPIVYCERCDPERQGIAVPFEALPVLLPDIDTKAVLTGKGEPPLAKVTDWVNTTCPKCQGPARREAETMDTFVDSTWYYARYLSPHLTDAPVDAALAQHYLPVDIYVGGPEHATMHLLYFRFWTRVMKKLGLVPMDEPVKRLVTQGIVNGPDGRKMSKRWGNVVTAEGLLEKYGADTARAYVLFAGPPERDIDWSDEQVEGVHRFLKRVWTLSMTHLASCQTASADVVNEGQALAIRRATHKMLKRVTDAIERLSFNTAIAGTMEFVNTLYEFKQLSLPGEHAAMREAMAGLCTALVPVAPHIANEIAEAYQFATPLEETPWLQFDAALTVDDVIPYAVQLNGKLRAEIQVAADATEAQVRAAAEANEKVAAALAGKTVKKFVFVPKRLANFVVG